MKIVLTSLLAVLCTGCEPKQPPPDPVCDARCLEDEERGRRLHSSDLLYTSPGFWRFFDDATSQVPIPSQLECPSIPEDGGVQLLWRRTLPAGSVSQYNSDVIQGSRNGLSVAGGRIAVSLSNYLWILDARTGVPKHGFTVGIWDAGAGNGAGVGLGPPQFAALTPDAKRVWVKDNGSPALVDLEALYENQAPSVIFSWYRDVQRPQGAAIITDTWAWATPNLDWEGTLYWGGTSGRKRAIESTGRIRWDEDAPGGGRAFLGAGGRSFWTMGSPAALHPSTGEVVWRAYPPPDAGIAPWYGTPIEVERLTPRTFAPIAWYSPVEGYVLAAHRLSDGEIAWTRSLNYVAAERSGTAQARDGTVYLSRPHRPEPNGADSPLGTLEALDEGTGVPRWTLDLPLYGTDAGVRETSHVSVGPIPAERKDGVYVVTTNCMVYDLDADGGVRGWYLMAAPPLGHTPQLVDGVLYVLAHARNVGSMRCPEDVSSDPVADYGCVFPPAGKGVLGGHWGCEPCIVDEVFFLYAFQVE